MHARIATFEGATDADRVRQGSDEIKRRAADGPPQGVPAVSLMIFYDEAAGKLLSITLYETEDDMRRGTRR